MRNEASRLVLHNFGTDSPLHRLPESPQRHYIVRYLADLGATTLLEEPNYFDRDYLAEFSEFYSRSAAGYPNVCSRWHFFSGPRLTLQRLRAGASGYKKSQKYLQSHYLGFIVIRPIPGAPFGRTVLAWYPDLEENETPRVVSPRRNYHVHFAGIELTVNGLAWQQQDTGVGACATVGLWAMLHSSAFDDHHAIPTTADITKAAHKKASMGARVFPSGGLTNAQICEAVKELGLAPLVSEGDIRPHGRAIGFSTQRFASSCAAFLRSGYPVLIGGKIEGANEFHVVCAVGFRSCTPRPVVSGDCSFQDETIPRVYVHDDNVGPNVRFDLIDSGAGNPVILEATEPPQTAAPGKLNPVAGYHRLIPFTLLAAAHEDIRTSPDSLHKRGVSIASELAQLFDFAARGAGVHGFGLTFSTRYVKLSEYVGEELGSRLKSRPTDLARIRLSLSERVPPMSLHLGVVRIGLDDSTPLVDILYDTTDSDVNLPAFAHVMFEPKVRIFLQTLVSIRGRQFGVPVNSGGT